MQCSIARCIKLCEASCPSSTTYMRSICPSEPFPPMQGFHKILKKHDKVLPHAPCQQFYLSHLHQQSWVQVSFHPDHPPSGTALL